MNEQLSKEARRNLRKEMGATAADALERARAEVLRLTMQHAAIAREMEHLRGLDSLVKDHHAKEIARLHARIDGTSAWCEQNEGLAKGTDLAVQALIPLLQIDGAFWGVASVREDCQRLTMAHLETTSQAAACFHSVIGGGFLVRLWWLLFGTVPYWVERERQSAAVREMGPMAAQQGAHVPSRQVIIE